MLSGGGDSVALLELAVRAKGPGGVEALHVNYGLRADATLDEQFCRELCTRLGVRLHVHRAELPPGGNLHANARAARYDEARRVAREQELELIATAHTADDQAETVLYRLASSPGRRPLRGMPKRDGMLIRPLLGVRRQELREYLERRGLEWREDSSNEDPRFARARVRRILAQLEDVHPAAVANINATAEAMRLEEDAVRELVLERLARLRGADGSIAVEDVARLGPAVAALMIRELAETATGCYVPVGHWRVAEVLALSTGGGTRRLDLGSGAIVEVAYGRLRVYAEHGGPRGASPASGGEPRDVPVGLPGRHDFLGWDIVVEPLEPAGGRFGRPGEESAPAREPDGPPYTIDLRLSRAAAQSLHVRTRRQGDRLRPLGLGGSKSLQDVFVDRKVPRAQRDTYPVVCCDEEILWVPGVVIGEPCTGVSMLNDPVAPGGQSQGEAMTVRISASSPPTRPSAPARRADS